MIVCEIPKCKRQHNAYGMCSMHYRRWQKTGDPLITLWDTTRDERFWAKVYKEPNSGCWLWTACLSRDGYGRVTVNKKHWLAHRRAWVLTGHTLPPKGHHLDHLCEVRSCVNPKHLEPVTMQENIRRGRPGKADLNRAKTHCKQGHPFAGDNLYFNPSNNGRVCRTCQRRWGREYQNRVANARTAS